MGSKHSCATLIALLGLAAPAAAQFSAKSWCKDSGTYCFPNSEKRAIFNGVRVVGEINFGTFIQNGANRFEDAITESLPLFALETNLYQGFLGLQAIGILPGGVTLDEDSDLVTSGRLSNTDRRVHVDYGFAIGLSLFDGAILAGYGRLYYDTRRFLNATAGDKHSSYTFVRFQPITALRDVIKGGKGSGQ